MTILRNVPLATQVATHLRGRLQRKYSDGGRLPGEMELAAELGVSRGTVRQALAILEQEGAVFRRQGDGTYANQQVLNITARAETAREFSELITNAGYKAQISLVKSERSQASEDLALHLATAPGTPVLVIHKVFSADGQPAIYCIDTVPTSLLDGALDEAELATPIFDLLVRHSHLQVNYILAEVIPIVADGELVDLLAVERGAPLLEFDETYYTETNQQIMFSRIYYKDPLIRFTILRKKL